jgi:hypothetical protein
MESAPGTPAIAPPWEHSEFLSEEGLRAAQEYYFQTHATHSRLIAQGRGAQGLAKSLLRRKLEKELGEDFKMYTGHNIGESRAPEDMATLGIRGELNTLLKHIYTRIAPTQPITSPTQEDVTILQHPHGALEVCYAMVFYYQSLLRQYASFAANRRKVLKSIMDEELFKWVWRMVIGFMMRPEEARLSLDDPFLAAGLAFVPQEQQRAPLGARIHEVGMFLLSKTLQESHLRMPLCYYYAVYVRQLQTLVALHAGPQELDDVYSLIARRVEGEPVEHPLVAIDALLNGKGNSMDAFDDVLKDTAQLGQYIPAGEFAFINQFEDFGNPQRLSATLKRLIPDVRREAIDGQETSLMPLLLTLRVMPAEVRKAVLEALPLPLLNLVRNRIANAPQDDIAAAMGEAIRATMESRKGEAYTVHKAPGRGAVASSVRPAPAAGQGAAPSAAPAAGSRTAALAGGRAAAPAGGRTAAPPAGGRAAASAAGDRAATPRAAPEAAPPRDPAAARQALAAQAAAADGASKTAYFDEPSMLAWRLDGERVAAISLSARELCELVGAEPRLLVPWVVFTLRTGQVFGLSPDRVSKERVEQVVGALRRQAGGRTGSLQAESLEQMLLENKGAPQSRLLLALVKAAGMRPFLRVPEAIAPAVAELGRKFGAHLMDFLRNPNDESFSGQRAGLSGEERQALVVLQRVARAQ